ncbi:3-keto-disaccharide hydrolase [Roseimaritima ulvae]|uniref:3-keto-alpha-glucoside-1,2-lyase/3-keto-2-hydroxy-glucal hydratase domain-containing protein n=1 Tax=Roseimaritima ulvae TaxID=980254 RepID=A0A5B9QYB6_9BACT|nr:DUF1080 domain-containing protein [Roseimaritima ulvae]QEG42126.1 hypothetical protein UC8_41590 [Roseimaritima ulvae]
MKRNWSIVLVLSAIATLSGNDASAETSAEPNTAGEGWVELVSEEGPVGFGKLNDKISRCGDATLADEAKQLEAVPGQGVVASLQRSGVPNLVSKQKFGDCEVQLEFLIAKGSNSGIKLQKRYEIQLYDSHGKDKLTAKDCGGIYPHWVPRGNGKGIKYIDEGVPAQNNAAEPAGQWQSLSIVFKAPRFDEEGNKIENGKFESVTLNGQVIHQDVEVDSPTGNAATPLPEVTEAPLMLQLDHGAVAFRKVRVKPL